MDDLKFFLLAALAIWLAWRWIRGGIFVGFFAAVLCFLALHGSSPIHRLAMTSFCLYPAAFWHYYREGMAERLLPRQGVDPRAR